MRKAKPSKEALMHRVLRMAVFSLLCLAPLGGSAQTATVSTTPVGYITLNIAAGTGTTSQLTAISFPLLGTASITGQSTGVITGITANTISNANAGWTAGALSIADSPYLIQITSGSAAGRTFLVSTSTANTATAVTIDAQESSQVNLTTLGIITGSSGDTYSIYPCDTLLSAFGQGSAVASATTVLGASTPDKADIVQLVVNRMWRQYYYNTDVGQWMLAGIDKVSNSIPIRPDAGVIYLRRAAIALTLSVSGQVPAVSRQTSVANYGMTFLSSLWPVDRTLAQSNISSIPGWVGSSSASNADIVQLFVQGMWRQYYYNTDKNQWMLAGIDRQSDSISIPVGSAVMLLKSGSSIGINTLSQPIPYSL